MTSLLGKIIPFKYFRNIKIWSGGCSIVNMSHLSSATNSTTGGHWQHDPNRGPTVSNSVIFPPDPKESGKEVINRIFSSFGLNDHVAANVQRQVEALCEGKGGTDDPALKDLTKRPFITIDNDDSMDLDQAMYMCRANPYRPPASEVPPCTDTNTGYLVSYALADGAYYVPAFTPLFDHALRRGGSSFYLPGRCIPMLPRALSEDKMSLNENVRRRALVFDMYLDTSGNIKKTDICWAVIKSRWKGSYRLVQLYYDWKDASIEGGFDVGASEKCEQAGQVYTETLDLLREVGIKRRALAAERNVVDYHRDGVCIYIDSEDGLLKIGDETRYESEKYNEQISLLCNSEGARIMKEYDEKETLEGVQDVVQPVFRSQNSPNQEQINVLESIITKTIETHGLEAKVWTWDRAGGVPLSVYLDNIREKVKEMPFSKRRKATPFLQVIERQAMITNVAASFTPYPEESGHYSLKLPYYARFSSPMREIVGCYTHKELLEGYRGAQSEGITSDCDYVLRKRVIRAAIRAKETQKKLNNALFLHMMNLIFYKDLQIKAPAGRPLYSGIIMGMDFSERKRSSRCYVKLEDPPIEIKVFGEDLNYHYMCRYGAVGDTFGHKGSTVEIAPRSGSFAESMDDDTELPTFKAGQRVCIQVSDYAEFHGQRSRSRWIFIMTTNKSQSTIRNCIIDRDDAQSQMEVNEEERVGNHNKK